MSSNCRRYTHKHRHCEDNKCWATYWELKRFIEMWVYCLSFHERSFGFRAMSVVCGGVWYVWGVCGVCGMWGVYGVCGMVHVCVIV